MSQGKSKKVPSQRTHWDKWEEYLKPFEDLKIEIKNIYFPEVEYEKTILSSPEEITKKEDPIHIENPSKLVDIPLTMAASIEEVKEYFKPFDPLEILYPRKEPDDKTGEYLDASEESEKTSKAQALPKETVIVVPEEKDLEKELDPKQTEHLFSFKSLTPKDLGLPSLAKQKSEFEKSLKNIFEDHKFVETTFESLNVTKDVLETIEDFEKIIETTHSPIERYVEVYKHKINDMFSLKNLTSSPSQTVFAGISGIMIGENKHGVKTSSLKYDQGKLNGTSATYHPDGSVKEQMNYENGQLNGLHETYDKDGNLVSSLTFKDGKLNGKGIFYENGRKYAEFEFVDGIQQGSSSTFYETGSVMTVSAYSSGKMDGDYKIFNDQGSISSVVPFREGKKTGKSTSYYATGEILETGPYTDDLKNGTFITYYQNGNPNQISQYQNGKLTDAPLQYSLKGREIDS